MDPFIFHFTLFNQPVSMGIYTVFFLLACLVALLGSFLFAIKHGFNGKKIAIIMSVVLVSSLVGARLLNALVNFSAYFEDPTQLWELSASGFSLYGGVIFALGSGVVCCRLLKIDSYRLGDICIPFLGISIATMRVGCFLNGCCFGKETHLPWGVQFPHLSQAHIHQIGEGGSFFDVNPVHPTQLYELFVALLLSIVTFSMLKKKLPTGVTLLTFIAAFSLFRLVNYYLRVNPDTFSTSVYFYPLLYLLTTIVCLVLIRKRFKTR